MKKVISINRDNAVDVILNDLKNNEAVVISGSPGSGKTVSLEEIACALGLKVNHVGEVDNPLDVGLGKLSLGDTILLDGVSSDMPREISSLKDSYEKVVVATHYFNTGEAYAKYLTGKDSVVYHLSL
ncbi:hypothetical protein HN903_02430 [archaeon]|jgi:hypothetical protein|nr:hypothetical protein [archaeon]MBT6956250.1 hypothetical protein [archaeon]MBT7128590.1 hypothetical protein [archaeon]